MLVGTQLGALLGALLGELLGVIVGPLLGAAVGTLDGAFVGALVVDEEAGHSTLTSAGHCTAPFAPATETNAPLLHVTVVVDPEVPTVSDKVVPEQLYW